MCNAICRLQCTTCNSSRSVGLRSINCMRPNRTFDATDPICRSEFLDRLPDTLTHAVCFAYSVCLSVCLSVLLCSCLRTCVCQQTQCMYIFMYRCNYISHTTASRIWHWLYSYSLQSTIGLQTWRRWIYTVHNVVIESTQRTLIIIAVSAARIIIRKHGARKRYLLLR